MLQYIIARPFIYIFLFLLFASLLSKALDLSKLLILSTAFISSICFTLSLLFSIQKLRPFFLLLSLFAIACFRIFHFEKSVSDDHSQLPENLSGVFELTISKLTIYSNRYVYLGTIKYRARNIKIQLTDWNKILPKSIFYADILIVNMHLTKIKKSTSRFLKPYDQFLIQRQIYYKATLSKCNYELEKQQAFSLIRSSQHISNYFKSVFEHYNITKESKQLLTGILLGDQSTMDKSLKEAFRIGGITHILAVSGMHLGIFYLLVGFLFKQFRKIGLDIPILYEIIFILLIIWLYTLLTGLGVAVCRSAIMLSLYEFAKLFKRKTQPVNILFAGASILIFYQPSNIYEIGFQLSCLALLGIFWLSKYIQRLYFPTTWVAQYIWSVISISLSVQIIITPICLYHFTSFPLYFIITNIIWAPATPLIMLAGLSIWFIHPISPFIGTFIMDVADIVITIALHGLHLINSLPYALVEKLWFEAEDCIIYFIILVLFGSHMLTRRNFYTYLMIFIQILGSTYYYLREKQLQEKTEWIAFPHMKDFEVLVLTKGECYSSANKIYNLETYLDRKHTLIYRHVKKQILQNYILNVDPVNYYQVKPNEIVHFNLVEK